MSMNKEFEEAKKLMEKELGDFFFVERVKVFNACKKLGIGKCYTTLEKLTKNLPWMTMGGKRYMIAKSEFYKFIIQFFPNEPSGE